MPDIEPFVSPIDGLTISGRAALREHNKVHNVTNVADYENEWRQKAKEREQFIRGDKSYDSRRRKEAIARAYDKLTRR